MQAITDETDLVIATALARGTHASAIKVYADLPADLVAAIVTEAHRQGIPVWAHLSVFPALPLDVVGAGVDVVSHVSLLAWQTRADAAATYKTRAPIDPTSVDPDDPRIAAVLDAMVERGTILDVTASMWESHEVLDGADAEAVTRAQGNAVLAAELTARAFAAGVPICSGQRQRGAPRRALPDAARRALLPPRALRHARGRGAARGHPGRRAQRGRRGPDGHASRPASWPASSSSTRTRSPTSRNLASIWCTVKRGTRYARADFTGGGPMSTRDLTIVQRARHPRQPERRAVARGGRPAQPQQRPAHHRRPDPGRRPRLGADRGQHHPRLHDGRAGAVRAHPARDRGLGPPSWPSTRPT